MDEKTTRILIARSAGRCAICRSDLLESSLSYKNIYIGERAHIVGRKKSANSPRGLEDLDPELRDLPENLMLLCGTCHDEIDDRENWDELTVAHLREMKAAHEQYVHDVMQVAPDNKTVVLRLQGQIGRSGVHVDPSTAASAVLAARRIAHFPLRPDRTGIEIDLRSSPTPDPGDSGYYVECRRKIDDFFERQFLPAASDGLVPHLSVFALCRWPLLVHLGLRIGDKITTDLYQRHRSTEDWGWPGSGDETEFGWAHESLEGASDPSNAALVLSLSADVQSAEIPTDLQPIAVYRVAPIDVDPHYDVISTPKALESAASAFRAVLSDIEANHKQVRSLHVLGAAPLSACLALGRAITPGVHPKIVLYDRHDNTYIRAMETNT